MENRTQMLTVTRTCGIVVLGLTIGYLLLAVAPFYANGIHLRTYQEIAGSLVDVKGYPPYSWFGYVLPGIAGLVSGYLPLLSLLLVPPLALGLKWSAPTRGERALWIAAIALNVLALALTWQVRGVMGIWLAD